MDLKKDIPSVQETAFIPLFHPVEGTALTTDEGGPMGVTVYGQDSDHYRKISRRQQRIALERSQRAGGRVKTTPEQIEESGNELLIGSIKEWNIQIEGEIPPLDADVVKRVFDEYPWIKEQVDNGIHDRKNFMTGS